MAKRSELTPSVIVSKIRENQNNNKTLKALFSQHFLGKFSDEELEGLKKSIDKIVTSRQQKEIDKKIEYLEKMGYKVSK